MCSEHTENASDVLLDWLQSQRIKFSVNMILLNNSIEPRDRFYDDIKQKVLQQDTIAAKSRHVVKNRESLQSGSASMMRMRNTLMMITIMMIRKITTMMMSMMTKFINCK